MLKTKILTMVTSTLLSYNLTTATVPYVNTSIFNDMNLSNEIITEYTKDDFTKMPFRQAIIKFNEQQELEKKLYKQHVKEIQEDNKRKENVDFDIDNVLIKSYITVDELNQVFDKMNQGQMKIISKACIDAEKEYGINAIFLASIVAQESGWTKKPAGDGTNLTGYCVYTNSSIGSSFDSYYDNILATAELLKVKYLTPGARYFNGYSTEAINTEYCKEQDQKTTKWSWHRAINRIGNQITSIYHDKVKTIIDVNEIK